MKKLPFEKISVIGLGYIGLPTAAMFASRKVKVIGVDVNKKAVETINKGKIHIVEPDLDMIVQATVAGGYLKATLTTEKAEAFLIAVPTPFKGDHEPDLSYVQAATLAIAPVLEKGNLVILESTSPVNTTEKMVEWLKEARPDLRFPSNENDKNIDVNVAYCPERVLPGQVVRELVGNDRIIGGVTQECSERAKLLYRIFVSGELFVTNSRTAEMCKLVENSYRDVNIAFANELSLICDRLDINVWELIKLANRHPRVNILQPGAGVGGHCIAVDPWFIVDKTPDLAQIIRKAREVNDYKPQYIVERVKEAIEATLLKGIPEKSINIAILGIAFKPNIDDLRESPALHIAQNLTKKFKCNFMIVEPNIAKLPADVKAGLYNLDTALERADIIVSLVAHSEFKEVVIPLEIKLIDCIGMLAK